MSALVIENPVEELNLQRFSSTTGNFLSNSKTLTELELKKLKETILYVQRSCVNSQHVIQQKYQLRCIDEILANRAFLRSQSSITGTGSSSNVTATMGNNTEGSLKLLPPSSRNVVVERPFILNSTASAEQITTLIQEQKVWLLILLFPKPILVL
jgi:hypothetical protein